MRLRRRPPEPATELVDARKAIAELREVGAEFRQLRDDMAEQVDRLRSLAGGGPHGDTGA